MNPQPATLQKNGIIATPTANTSPAQVAAALGAGFTPLAANTNSPATVPPAIIGTQPINVPVPTPYYPVTPTVPAPTGAGTTIDANGNVIINPPTPTRTPTQTKLDEIGAKLQTEGDVTTQLQNDLGLADKTLAATKSYNAYNSKKLEYQQKIDAMKTAEANTGGVGGGGYSASITDFERKANADLANLALQAQMDQGLLTATEKTIQDKLDAQFQPLKDQAAFFFNLANNENNDLTESQKIKLTQLGTQKQKEADAVQSTADDIHKALVENGHPELFSAVDKVINDYATGKINAAKATSQMYEATGANGISSKLTHVQLANGQDVMVDSRGKIVSTLGSSNGGGNGAVTLPENKSLVDAFNSAASGLPSGPRINQARGIFNGLVNDGNITAAKEYVVRTAVEGMPTADQSQIVGRMQAKDSLTEVQGLLDAAKTAGASTNILSGNIVNIAQKLGTSSNQDLSYIGSRIQQLLQTYRRSMTGVAFSPGESAEYKKIMPDITNIDDLNKTKIQALVDGFNSNNRTALSFAIGPSTYDKVFGPAVLPKLPSQQADNKPATSGSFGNITWKITQ